MSKKKKETDMLMPSNAEIVVAATSVAKAPKVDFASEVTRLRAIPNMSGVADKLAEAVADESAMREQLKGTRRRLRKMYSGILTVLGESK